MAPRTEMARQVTLSGHDIELFASLGRVDDYLELELPRSAYASGLLEGLDGLPTELAGDRLDWRARDGDPPILSFMLLRSGSHQPADPAPARLGRLLSEIARLAPGFDFGELAPKPPAEAPIPSPMPALPVAQTAPRVEAPAPAPLSEQSADAPPTGNHPGKGGHNPAWLMDRSSIAVAMEHARRGRTHQALRILNEVLSRTPGHQEAHHLRDSLRLMERREKRRRREPRNAQAQLEAGFSYLALNRGQDALDALTSATRLDPRHHLAHLLLGIAYHREGRADSARAAYLRSSRLRPDPGVFPDLLSALDRGDPPPELAEAPVSQPGGGERSHRLTASP